MVEQQEQGWANTGPWLFFAVAVLTACAGGWFGGLVPASSAPLLVGILLACSLPQLIGAIILFRRGEILLASIAGLFGTVITLGAAFTIAIQVRWAPEPGAFTSEVMGFFWITLFVITEVFAVGFGRASWFLMGGVAEVGVSFLFLGIYALAGSPVGAAGYVEHGAALVGGYLLIIFAAFCIYAATAILWAEHFGRPMLPLGKPVFK